MTDIEVQMMQACYGLDYDEIYNLLPNCDINHCQDGHNFITWALVNCQYRYADEVIPVIELLRKYGADLHYNSVEGNGLTIILNRPYSEDYIIIEYLIEHNLSCQSELLEWDFISPATILQYPQIYNYIQFPDWYIHKHADYYELVESYLNQGGVLYPDMIQSHVFSEMFKSGKIKHIKLLIQAGYQLPPHCMATTIIQNGLNYDIINLLLDYDINQTSSNFNILEHAIRCNNVRVAKLLIMYGYDTTNMIYVALSTSIMMIDFISQYNEADVGSVMFSEALYRCMATSACDLLGYVLNKYDITTDIITKLYICAQDDNNNIEQKLDMLLSYRFPYADKIKIYGQINAFRHKLEQTGIFVSGSDDFRLCCANGRLSEVKRLLKPKAKKRLIVKSNIL
jgi:hypothetical protein